MNLLSKLRQTAAYAVLVFTAVFLISSCSKEKESPAQLENEVIHLEITQAPQGTSSKAHSWHSCDKQICIVFGYGYNEKSFVENTISTLDPLFGLASNGGLILPLVYPDDFPRNNSSRIYSLKQLISDYDLCGIILLGAPENTNAALSSMEDTWDGWFPFPVFSFFPQDDILGMEATADFVIDHERVAGKGLQEEENEAKADINIIPLLERAILYQKELPGPLPADDNLRAHVQQIVGSSLKIERYTDSETGLQSINHFVIK